MKQLFFLALFLLTIVCSAQNTPEVRSYTRAKLTEVRLVSELSSNLPADMRKASVEVVCKEGGKVLAHVFTGDTLYKGFFKNVDRQSKIYFDVKSAGPKPKAYSFAILLLD